MLETMTLDSKTLIIKSDNEEELSEVINVIKRKDRLEKINSFLKFASENSVKLPGYKFNREDCYDR
jgi:U3 small nucleolar ribonucleoprotein component